MTVQPGTDPAQLQGAGYFAGAQRLILEQQGSAGRFERLQQRTRIVQQRAAPIAIARDGLDHALLQPPDREFGLGPDEALQGCDPGGDSLGQQFAYGAHFIMNEAWRVVMAGDQSPQLAADHQGHDQRRIHPHVLQVLDVDGRHAAQKAQRHIEFPVGDRRALRRQRYGCVVDIDQHPDAILDVQAAGDLRDIGGGVAVAEKRFQFLFAALGEHFAMALLVEAIDHDPIVAGEVLEDPGGFVAQRAQGRGGLDGAQRSFDMPGQIDGRSGPFQFDDQTTPRGAVQQAIVFGCRIADATANGPGNRVQRIVQMGLNPARQTLGESLQRAAEEVGVQPEKRCGIVADLHHGLIGFVDDQQRAVRLDGAGQVDLFALAVRQIRLTEGGWRGGWRGHFRALPVSQSGRFRFDEVSISMPY